MSETNVSYATDEEIELSILLWNEDHSKESHITRTHWDENWQHVLPRSAQARYLRMARIAKNYLCPPFGGPEY